MDKNMNKRPQTETGPQTGGFTLLDDIKEGFHIFISN